MQFEGLVIAFAAVIMFPVCWRLRRRLGVASAVGWGRLHFGLSFFVLTGLLIFVLSIPQFMSLFMPSVADWFRITSYLSLALGLIWIFWGLAGIVNTIRVFREQTTDEANWQEHYLQLQELAVQPFSFVEILNVSLKQLQVRSNSDGAAVMLHKENSNELILAAFSDLSPETAKKLEKLSLGGDLFGRAQKLGRIQLVPNMLESDKTSRQLLDGSGFLSATVFPLRTSDKIAGCVSLFSTKPYNYNQERVGAMSVATNYLAMILQSVRSSKEISKLIDRLKPSEEAKRITEELFFRRGIGGNLQLREAVEFERVRKFFDADCIKLVAKEEDGEFRIRASSGGAELGLLLDKRKLAGISRAVSERKLLLLTSPKSSPAGGGFDSMPRQTLFVPIPYPEREDLVLLLESETATLRFSSEKLSAVRVASVYLADLHFLFIEKRNGEKFRSSVLQIGQLIEKLIAADGWEDINDLLVNTAATFLPPATAHLTIVSEHDRDEWRVMDEHGLDIKPEHTLNEDNAFTSALANVFTESEGKAVLISKTALADQLPPEFKDRFQVVLGSLPEMVQQVAVGVKNQDRIFGIVVLYFKESMQLSKESIEFFKRFAQLAGLSLALKQFPQAIPKAGEAVSFDSDHFNRLNDVITGILGHAQLMEHQASDLKLPERFAGELRRINESALLGSELLKQTGRNMEIGLGSNPTSEEHTRPTTLDELTANDSIDSELKGTDDPSVQEALHSMLVPLVNQMFKESGRRIFLSSYTNDRFSYFQVTDDKDEMMTFRQRKVSNHRWKPSSGAENLPEVFRSQPAEYRCNVRNNKVITVEWRIAKIRPEPKKERALRILAIEDQEVIRELLRYAINSMGHHIVTAVDGAEGLELFEPAAFDMVIAEAGLPGINGWEIAQTIKERSPATPVVILSGWGMDELSESTNRQYVDFIVTKPFKMEQLGKVLTEVEQQIAD